jgi:hypothetical protein
MSRPPTVIIILFLLAILLYLSPFAMLGILIEYLAYSMWFAYDYESKRDDSESKKESDPQ